MKIFITIALLLILTIPILGAIQLVPNPQISLRNSYQLISEDIDVSFTVDDNTKSRGGASEVREIKIINKDTWDYRFQLLVKGIIIRDITFNALSRTETLTISNRFFLDEEYEWHLIRTRPKTRPPGSVSNPVFLASGGSSSGSTTLTTATLSPAVNTLIIVSWGGHDAGNNPDVITGITETFTDTQVTDFNTIANGVRSSVGMSWTTGYTTGTGTFTATWNTLHSDRGYIAYTVTGNDTVVPSITTNEPTTTGVGTVGSVTFNSEATAGNIFIGTISDRGNNNITAGTNETELAEIHIGGSSNLQLQTEYNDGTDTNVNWTTLDNRQHAIAGLEVKEASATTPRRISIIAKRIAYLEDLWSYKN